MKELKQNLGEPKLKTPLGVSGVNQYTGAIRADEFDNSLSGQKGIKVYREMRDNSPEVGAAMYAIEQTLRDNQWVIKPAEDDSGEVSEPAKEAAKFLRSVFEDMEHSLDDYISEALSFLTYGFVAHEVVYKRRLGPYQEDKKKRSKYSDGRLGIRKLSPRAQWTIDEFIMGDRGSEVLGVKQTLGIGGVPAANIPKSKMILINTTSLNHDPSGRSILRNAVKPWKYLDKFQEIEAIATERELNGLPLVRMPSEYLSSDATDEQVAVRDELLKIARDVKNNSQGAIMLPSDTYADADGKPTNAYLVTFELIASQGTRNIEIDPVVRRYKLDIFSSLMAEFITLGNSTSGSYALSKSKTNLFLKALESYINTIFDCLNQQLVEQLWRLNGMDFKYLPKIVPGDVAPHDLKELGSFLRNLNGAGLDFRKNPEIVNALLIAAGLPDVDPEEWLKEQEEKEAKLDAKLENKGNEIGDKPGGKPNSKS